MGVLLSFLGGYPVGAKAVCTLYEKEYIHIKEAQRLFLWCVNPGISFCITAVGTFMLKNTLGGIIIYISIILSSFTLGLISGFFVRRKSRKKMTVSAAEEKSSLFIKSVSDGSNATLSLSCWILIFSCIGNVLNELFTDSSLSLFLNLFFEVTNACKTAIDKAFSLPFICSIISFGGLAVIFQISPYFEKCGITLKNFICMRIINGALSGIFCKLFTFLFPQTAKVSATLSFGNVTLNFSHSLLGTIICILMCILFIFEVDNRKKIC